MRVRPALVLRSFLALGSAVLIGCASSAQPAPARSGPTVVGPESGALFVAGGGTLDRNLIARFVELAGGANSHIVVIPTASEEDSFPATWQGLQMFRDAGATRLTILHTRSRDVADSDAFIEPLRAATGVWFSGGRQWRLADVYNDTRMLREVLTVLDRGGVVGGTSAGASVLASYMVRGAIESNEIVMAPGRDIGFGLLRNTAIDQHLTARDRQEDMLEVVRRYPSLLGIGIDEGTALIVTRDLATVAGRGRVAFYNTADAGDVPYYFLHPGDVFDLARRMTVTGVRTPPQIIADEAAVIAAMNRLFDAMRMRDTAAVRSLMHPDMRVFVSVTDSSGQPSTRVVTPDGLIGQIATATERLNERAIRPEVRIDGNLASVWTYYEFVLGQNFSHCGTDTFHFIRTASGWVMTALAYNYRFNDCRR